MKLKKFYIDTPSWNQINIDDFIVAVGAKRSNSVYHVAEVKHIPRKKNPRVIRNYVKVYPSDLITCLKRDNDQKLIPVTWYSRSKKSK